MSDTLDRLALDAITALRRKLYDRSPAKALQCWRLCSMLDEGKLSRFQIENEMRLAGEYALEACKSGHAPPLPPEGFPEPPAGSQKWLVDLYERLNYQLHRPPVCPVCHGAGWVSDENDNDVDCPSLDEPDHVLLPGKP